MSLSRFISPHREIVCGMLSTRDILAIRGCSRHLQETLVPAHALHVWRKVFERAATAEAEIVEAMRISADAEVESKTLAGTSPYLINKEHAIAIAEIAGVILDPITEVATVKGVILVETARFLLGTPIKRSAVGNAIVLACRYGHYQKAEFLTTAYKEFNPPIGPYTGPHVSPLPDVAISDHQVALRALKEACAHNNLPAAVWVTSYFRLSKSDMIAAYFEPLIVSCQNGHLVVAEWVVKQFEITKQQFIPHGAIGAASKHNHLPIVRWLSTKFGLERHHVLDGGIFGEALFEGSMSIVKWFVNNFRISATPFISAEFIDRQFQAGCENGNTEAISWMYDFFGLESEFPLLKKGFEVVCKRNCIQALKWFLAKVPSVATAAVVDADCRFFRSICAIGHAEVVELLITKCKLARRWQKFGQDFAQICRYGHLPVLQLLTKAFKFDPSLTKPDLHFLQSAAGNGSYSVVRWLMETWNLASPFVGGEGTDQLWLPWRPLDEMKWLYSRKLFSADVLNSAFLDSCAMENTSVARWLIGTRLITESTISSALNEALGARRCDIVHLLRHQATSASPP